MNQLLTTVGSDFVVEMTDSDETPEQDRREVLAEVRVLFVLRLSVPPKTLAQAFAGAAFHTSHA